MSNKNGNSILSDVTEIPTILKEPYITSLNGFRTISITFVIFGHVLASKTRNVIFNHWVEVRSLGVYIFFVISGFLITTLLLKEKVKTGDISLTNFYKKRVLRIIPLAYLYPTVLLILNYFLKLHIPLMAFAGPFIFLSNWGFFNRSGYFGHYWSLAIEEQYYLFFPILLKRNFKAYVIFLISTLMLLMLLRQFDFIAMKGVSRLYYFEYLYELVEYFDGIIIGSFLSILLFKNMLPLAFLEKHKTLINLFVMPLILIVHCQFFPIGITTVNTIFTSGLVALLIANNIQGKNDFFFRLLNNKFISYIGTMSYSIYIWQQLFTFLVKPIFGGYFNYANTMSFNLVLLAVVSYISYTYYEKRFLKLKSKIVY